MCSAASAGRMRGACEFARQPQPSLQALKPEATENDALLRRAGNFSQRPAYALLGAAAPDQASSRTDPIIDIHQHLNYSGRSDAALLAHQVAMGATTTILLPSGRPLSRPSTHEGKSNGLDAQALGNEACWQFARSHRATYRFAANEVPDIPEARAEIEQYLAPRRRNDCRTEIRCRVRFAGDAAPLRAGPGARRPGADALAVRDVQQGLRAVPPHAGEIPAGALSSGTRRPGGRTSTGITPTRRSSTRRGR